MIISYIQQTLVKETRQSEATCVSYVETYELTRNCSSAKIRQFSFLRKI